ncbi:MAG: SCO family protein [Anaerolinea sp.]|nr:SCO family protein [Anaerolinea sp.]
MNSKWLLLSAICALVAVLTGCAGSAAPAATPERPAYVDELVGAVVDPPRQLAEFNLESTHGGTFHLTDYRGDVILLYFGYRSCPDFCPTTFANMRRVSQDLGELADRVQVIFVTVDPERDTLDLLGLYTQSFNESYIGLRGEGDTLQAVMDQFGVVATKQPLGDSPLAYLMDHTATVFLIDPDGRLQSQYLYGTDYRDIVHDVRLILEASPQA